MDYTSMVERKLTGVICTIPIEIPFDAFDLFVTQMYEHLNYLDVAIDKADVAVHPGVLQAFEQGLRSLLADVDWNEATDNIDIEDTVDLLFPEEVKAAMEAEEERSRLAHEAYMEQLRLEQEERDERMRLEQEARRMVSENAASRLAALQKELNDPNTVTVVIKNRFVRKLVQLFGEKV
jgi:hypothetical protein